VIIAGGGIRAASDERTTEILLPRCPCGANDRINNRARYLINRANPAATSRYRRVVCRARSSSRDRAWFLRLDDEKCSSPFSLACFSFSHSLSESRQSKDGRKSRLSQLGPSRGSVSQSSRSAIDADFLVASRRDSSEIHARDVKNKERWTWSVTRVNIVNLARENVQVASLNASNGRAFGRLYLIRDLIGRPHRGTASSMNLPWLMNFHLSYLESPRRQLRARRNRSEVDHDR